MDEHLPLVVHRSHVQFGRCTGCGEDCVLYTSSANMWRCLVCFHEMGLSGTLLEAAMTLSLRCWRGAYYIYPGEEEDNAPPAFYLAPDCAAGVVVLSTQLNATSTRDVAFTSQLARMLSRPKVCHWEDLVPIFPGKPGHHTCWQSITHYADVRHPTSDNLNGSSPIPHRFMREIASNCKHKMQCSHCGPHIEPPRLQSRQALRFQKALMIEYGVEHQVINDDPDATIMLAVLSGSAALLKFVAPEVRAAAIYTSHQLEKVWCLSLAASFGHVDILKRLLELYSPLPMEIHLHAIIDCVNAKRVKCLDLLLSHPESLRCSDPNDEFDSVAWTPYDLAMPLELAVRSRSAKCVSLILKQLPSGVAPPSSLLLDLCYGLDDEEHVATLLLEAGASLDDPETFSGRSAIEVAEASGNVEMTSQLRLWLQ